MYVKAYHGSQPRHQAYGDRPSYYWLDRPRDYPLDRNGMKTIMVLGSLGIGKSTVLNKLSMSESEPFKAEF